MTDTKQEDANSKKMIVGMIVAVFVANLAILGYAVHMSTSGGHGEEPGDASHATSTHATGTHGASSTASHATPPPDPSTETTTPPEAEPGSSGGASAEKGKETYMILCMACHGEGGEGDGPASSALNPKPRNHTDAEWQESTSDEKLRSVIREGGLANDLSPVMAPFPQLSDVELDSVVLYIRSLAK